MPCPSAVEQQRECEWRSRLCECEQRFYELEHEQRLSAHIKSQYNCPFGQHNRMTLQCSRVGRSNLRGTRASATLVARQKAETYLKRLKAYERRSRNTVYD